MIVRDLLLYQVANEIGADYFASGGIYAEVETKFEHGSREITSVFVG